MHQKDILKTIDQEGTIKTLHAYHLYKFYLKREF